MTSETRRRLLALLVRWGPALLVVAAVTAYYWDALTTHLTVEAVAKTKTIPFGQFGDVTDTYRPLTHYHFDYVNEFGGLPQWFDRGGLGYPAALAGQHGVQYPLRLLVLALAPSAGAAADLLVWIQTLIAGLAALALARLYGLRRWTAAMVAVAYVLMHIPVRWAPYYHAPAYFAAFPVALLGIELIWRRRALPGFGLLALGIGISGLGSHLQLTAMLFQALGLVVLYRLLADREPWRERVTPLAVCAAGVVVGLVIASPVWLPFLQEQGESTRQGAEASMVVGMADTTVLSFQNPHASLKGISGGINGDLYVGMLAPLLAAAGVVVAARSRRLAVLPLLLALALLIGFKTPLFDALFEFAPGWNVFSNVERLALVMTLPLALLAGVGVDWALDRWPGRRVYPVAAATVAAGALYWQIRMGEIGLASRSVAALAVLVIAFLAYRWWAEREERGPSWAPVAVPLAIVVLTFAGAMRERQMGWEPVADAPPPSVGTWMPLVSETDDPDGRWMSYCQHLVLPYAYHPMAFLEVPGRWLDLYESFTTRSYHDYWRTLTRSERVADKPTFGEYYMGTDKDRRSFPNPALMNATGVDRILTRHKCDPDPRWELEGKGRKGFRVYSNPGAFPMAYVSRRWRSFEADALETAQRIGRGPESFRAHSDYVNDSLTGPSSQADPAPATVQRDGAEEVTVDFPRSREGSLLVLLDSYHPDWKAYGEDGEARSTEEVNGVFRGVVLEPGETRITFRYRPWWRVILPVLSWLALIAVLITLGLAAWRRRQAAQPDPPA